MNDNSVVYFLGSQVLPGTCREMVARGPEICNSMGYTTYGIQKSSLAADGMSIEARANGGGVPKMRNGGITASLQSIGAAGYIKPEAAASIHDGLVRGGIKRGGDSKRLGW